VLGDLLWFQVQVRHALVQLSTETIGSIVHASGETMTTVVFLRSPTQGQLVELETLDRESYVYVDGTANINGVEFLIVMSPDMRSDLSMHNLGAPALQWSEDPSYNWKKNK